ncbi:MAG: hypothetical protein AAFV95_17470 [Bacteroidota bacterium]
MIRPTQFSIEAISKFSLSDDQCKSVKGGTTFIKICDRMQPKKGDEGTHQSKAHLFTNQSANANSFLSALRLRMGL